MGLISGLGDEAGTKSRIRSLSVPILSWQTNQWTVFHIIFFVNY